MVAIGLANAASLKPAGAPPARRRPSKERPGVGYGNPKALYASADFSKPVNAIAWLAASDRLIGEDHKIAAKLLRHV